MPTDPARLSTDLAPSHKFADTQPRDRGDNQLFDLAGRTAFVTGAASGLGFAIAEVLATHGAQVMMTDINGDGIDAAARQLSSRDLAAHPAALDVGDPDALAEAIKATHQRFGALDIVCANAGISGGPGPRRSGGELAALSMAKWNHLLQVNLTSVMVTIQTAAALMIPHRRGRIMVTASMAGLRGDPDCGYAYATTKAAVANLVRQAAIELGQHNITVNAIAPGPFRTNIGNGRLHVEEVAQNFAARTMLGRVADPNEIKGLALLLCSDASSFMTGTVIPIDGGTLSW